MTDKNTQAVHDISAAMDELSSTFTALKSLILNKQNTLAGEVLQPDTGEAIKGDSRENLIKALGDWDIHPSSNSGEVMRYPGYFIACDEIIEAVYAFNAAKDKLTSTTKALMQAGTSEREMRTAYAKCGFPLIHPLQARRTIKVISNENLKRISFSIANRIESIEKISVKLACKRLENNDAHDISALLANMSPDDTVRWHKPVSSHIRANILHQDSSGERFPKMIHSSLPIMIVGGHELPSIVFNQAKERRKKRSDTLSSNRIAIPFVKHGFLSFDI